MSTIWINEDGLKVRFPLDNGATPRLDGSNTDDQRKVVFGVVGVDVPDTDTNPEQDDIVSIPAGAVVTAAWTIVDEAFVGAGTLDLGFKAQDGTNVADDGIDSIAGASLTADAVIAADGSLIGTKFTVPHFFMATYDTAAFTAGRARVVVEYML